MVICAKIADTGINKNKVAQLNNSKKNLDYHQPHDNYVYFLFCNKSTFRYEFKYYDRL